MFIEHDAQARLENIPFAEFVFNEEHPLLRLAEALNWKNLLSELAHSYSPDQGRPSIPLRSQVGTLILKFIKNLPDRAAVELVEENLYAQRFCGLSPAQAAGYMNPASGLTRFRAKIGPEGMAVINELLTAASCGKSYKRADKLILDTTCVPLDILYPTDIRLLERCRREILRLMKRAKTFGVQALYRTYARTARKIFVTFSKRSKPSEKVRRRVHKKMFQFVRRNLKQLLDLHRRATRLIGPRCPQAPEAHALLKDMKAALAKIRVVLHQQAMVRRGIVHISGRIVSFHKNHARPIVRGKFPLPTEFGPKVLFALVKKRMHVVGVFYNNVSDATLILSSLKWFKARFGHLPKELFGDRGFYSRLWVKWLTFLGIESGLQPRGKNVENTPRYRRMVRRRLPVEANISLVKRCHGLRRCLARNIQHEPSWIAGGVAGGNAHKAFFLPRRRDPPRKLPGGFVKELMASI